MNETFRALRIDRGEDKTQSVAVAQMSEDELMEGTVTVAVEASTINYKDGLAVTGRAPVVRRWPMVPGIDFAGTVLRSEDARYKPGDKVLLNGWGTGETHLGAYAGRSRVPGDWLIPLPTALTPQQAMGVGTAGYTAMLAVMALEERGLSPRDGAAVVTGANGGVGTVAVAILAKLGWTVIAVTGRPQEEAFLRELGASEILPRSELSEPGRPLGRERWAAGVDSVGGHTLANLLAQCRYGGAIAACGLAGGTDLPSTVMPFILRGVALLGIDSVMASRERRIAAWQRIVRDLDLRKLDAITTTIGFDEIIPNAAAILDGKVRGRLVVDMTR